ncbi:149aa long hypothetical protein [Pyrococcus horikoshii OT3]|uniref:Uncharacterized protein n=1 Tax=Pyrococcus horikoshii (strain ATCC 700860 / DSM 12428 / JCM 9974 / NBRC 100139 / OT-3) TaxID=70601 RepID=O59187_PYRHO|nr:149aa long hypothetical protein [Pyrococcus horikoshii OT3]
MFSSSLKNSRRSASSISALFPTLTTAESPIFSSIVHPIRAIPRAPLWLINANGPGRTSVGPKVAFNFAGVYTTPNMLGPSILIPYFLAVSTNCCSTFFPSSPSSPNPDEIIGATFTPFFPHSSTTSGTDFAGTTITAISTSSGTSKMLL